MFKKLIFVPSYVLFCCVLINAYFVVQKPIYDKEFERSFGKSNPKSDRNRFTEASQKISAGFSDALAEYQASPWSNGSFAYLNRAWYSMQKQ